MLDTHDFAERRPSLVIHARDADVAVFGRKRAPYAMQKLMPAARALRLLISDGGIIYLHPLHRDHGAVDRCVDALRFSCAIARDDRGENSRRKAGRARMIRDEN